MVEGLRPPALDELGLSGAVEQLADRLTVGTDLFVDVQIAGPPTLPAAVEVAAYRVAQEALTNVVRHADAGSACVRLVVDAAALTVEIADDGIGLPAEAVAGVGLSSMRERAEEMGGSCRVEAGPGGGTRVVAVLPLPERS
jgi:signal transduction histidine kinase